MVIRKISQIKVSIFFEQIYCIGNKVAKLQTFYITKLILPLLIILLKKAKEKNSFRLYFVSM